MIARGKKPFFSGFSSITLEVENMELLWLDERTARLSGQPNVTLEFADEDDEQAVEAALGMLLQAFSK